MSRGRTQRAKSPRTTRKARKVGSKTMGSGLARKEPANVLDVHERYVNPVVQD
jgi:hypothetical protein